jgi:hypothetical protein
MYTEMLYGKIKGFGINVLIMIIEKDINELYLLNFISSFLGKIEPIGEKRAV